MTVHYGKVLSRAQVAVNNHRLRQEKQNNHSSIHGTTEHVEVD